MHRDIGDPAWPHDPYKGLANYECDDRHLFAGRDEEIDICAQLLANAMTKLLVLHGQTGCGKSSFLRAGLIPALEEYGAGYLFLRRPASGTGRGDPSFIRCGDDPLARIAEEIFLFTEQPLVVPTATGPKQIELGAARLGIEGLDAFIAECADPHRLFNSLERLTDAIPHTLVLILDQVEEIITLNGSDKRNPSRFARFIKYLATSDIDMRFLLAIRKDHSGQFIESIQIGSEMSAAFRTFFLSDLSREGIRAAILRPTLKTLPKDSAAPGPFEVYGFEYASGVVDSILDDLEALIPAGASLPVMQIVCRDLYEQVRQQSAPRVIEMPLYQQGGGITGRVKRHVVHSLREVLRAHRQGRSSDLGATGLKWLRLLKRLVQEEGDGRVHTNVVPRKTLAEWADKEGIDGNIDPIIDGLADPKVLVLRWFAVFAPGTASEHELICLGHDMVGIALRDALRDAEESQHVSGLERKRVVQVFGAVSIALVAAAIIGLSAMRTDAVRGQKVGALLTQSALSRNDDPLQSLALAREAQRLVQGSLNEDERPSRAVANLLSGLPVRITTDRTPPPIADDARVYPTYALNRRGGLAVLRSGGVLRTYTVAGLTTDMQTFVAPAPLATVDGKLPLQSLQFSDASPELLLGIYEPLNAGEPGGVIAFPRSGTPRLFRQDEVVNALGRQDGASDTAIDTPRLFGVSGDLIVLFGETPDRKSIRLATVRVTPSLDLATADRSSPDVFPHSSQVEGKYVLSYFHPETVELVQGISTRVVTRVRAKNLTSGAHQDWDVAKFRAVRECVARSPMGRRCDVTSIPDLQQPGIVVLGLWEYSNSRYGSYPRGFISDLLIIALESGKATEVDLRSASAARQSCLASGIASPGGAAKDKTRLSDDDVPTFLMKGAKGLLLGYASPTTAQLINVTSVPVTCNEVFSPGVSIDAWQAAQDGGKLLGLTRDGGFVWDFQAAIPANNDAIANRLAQACAGQLAQFVRRPGDTAAKGATRQQLLDGICR
jgi:hypothetical protein